MKVKIIGIDKENKKITTKLSDGAIKVFELSPSVRVDFAKLGDAEITIKNNKITFLKSIQLPQIKTADKYDNDYFIKKQRIIVRQHTQKVAVELWRALAEVNEAKADIQTDDLVKEIIRISHKLEEDIFREDEKNGSTLSPRKTNPN